MSNPFFNNGAKPTMPGVNMGQIKQIYNMLRNSANPDQMLNQLLAKNPQMAQSINLIKANGNYEQVFRSMCKERGINPDEFIKQINS